jgi:type IV pilus assembly protein PilN
MIKINLLPVEERGRQEDQRSGLWIILGLSSVGAVCLLLLFAYSMQSRALSDLRGEVATLEALQAKYRPMIERVNQLTQERRELEAKLAVIDELDAERSFRVRLLEDLNRKMPRYAWLTKFTESGGSSAEIQGKTFSNLVVSDFMTSLEDSRLYDAVDLSVTKKGEIGEREVVEFRLTASLTKAPAASAEDATASGDGAPADPATAQY